MNIKPSNYEKYPPRAIELVKDAIKKAGCFDFNQVCYAVEDIVEAKRGNRQFDDYLERKGIGTVGDVRKIMELLKIGGK
jgi:hypothetical protein